MFLESCPFLLDCWICWHIIVHSILLWCFVFLQYQLCFLLFHFLFYLDPLSFLLGEPGQRFVNFVYPFKEPALAFIDFFSIVFNLYLFYFPSIFIISFLCWLQVLFVILFLLGHRLGCLFEIFLVFWGRPVS